MQDKNQEKQKAVNPLTAVATGMIIGAGVTAAGAVILQDKKKREKVKKVVKDVKNQVTGYMDDLQNKAIEEKKEGTEKVLEQREELKKKAAESIDSAAETLEEVSK